MDVIASNDKRLPHEKIERIRNLRPDMILLSGGVDGGTTSHVVELAEIIAAANPTPRLGIGYDLPVIFAGNIDARDLIQNELEGKMSLEIVDNLRPVIEHENLLPTRMKIQDEFLEHVMAHAPGYAKLIDWADAPIIPTPGAVGAIIQTVAEQKDIQVVGVDIGGATTDVFSVFENREGEATFNRTVSANLGMSYSISNVLAEATLENILRWLPFDIDDGELRNRIKNKTIRPTTVPQTLQELTIEQAIAREALRLAFEQHKQLAVELRGVQQQRTISEAFAQSEGGESLVNMMGLDMIIGSGGVISHAPRRQQAMLMMIDAFQPQGITRLAVDSIFMMPQLGVLAHVNPAAATQVFERDCLIHLGTCVAPVGVSNPGDVCISITLERDGMDAIVEDVPYGEVRLFPLGADEKARLKLDPDRRFAISVDRGHSIETEITGGVVGLVVDTRGRPLNVPMDYETRVGCLKQWLEALKIYPNM